MLNPKIMVIIDQYFPNIVEHHIRTRSPLASAREGLLRYRDLGYETIRRLSVHQQEENRTALDDAYAYAMKQLDEFHARERGKKGEDSRSDADVS